MNVQNILDSIPNISVLVVGDICLDRWCDYSPAAAEPSRETGIPRIGITKTVITAGAGGTVANNLAALGATKIATLGVVGPDGFAHELRTALGARGVDHSLLVEAANWQTFTYTKVINETNAEEDMPRLDFINLSPLPPDVEAEVIRRFNASAPNFDSIIVADQAETDAGGVVTPALRDAISQFAAANPTKVVWVDSRLRIEHFRHAILKPNESEAEAALARANKATFNDLQQLTSARHLIVTLGGNGAMLIDNQGERRITTKPEPNPVDICGAGDSFTAGGTLAYAVTRDPETAIRFGNIVASITIMKKGTGTASPAEVIAKSKLS